VERERPARKRKIIVHESERVQVLDAHDVERHISG
jgi:hypothetical protein